MKCPLCNVDLQMTVRQDIEIDYCPRCRGIWLDRGELDKLIERSTPSETAPPVQQPSYRTEHDEYHGKRYGDYRRHKKKSFLRELFDFD